MQRALKPGWERIGPICKARRRSLWLLTQRDLTDKVVAFEICGGREGDDLYYRFEQGSPRFADLLQIAQIAAKSRVDGEDARGMDDFLDGFFRVGPAASPSFVRARVLRTEPSPEMARYRARGGDGIIVDLGDGIQSIEFWCMDVGRRFMCLFEPTEAVFPAVVDIVSMALTCRNS